MSTELEQKLENIKKLFDIDKILSLSPDKRYIQKYYRVNKWLYTFFHTRTDRMYMGISRDGVYKEDDLLGIARLTAGYIAGQKAKTVLELATGRGANSLYLAQQFPDTRFLGVDISKTQLSLARKKARLVQNYFPAFGDYHDLSRFEAGMFDVVFVVEALCYSIEKETVLREVKRVLKDGGLFVIFDGYSLKAEEALTVDEKVARGLFEKGMALAKFENYALFLEKARPHFQIKHEENLSESILPTMYRFERLGKRFFRHPHLAKLMTKVLPELFLNNVPSGYLMPTMVKDSLWCYMLTVLKKQGGG